MAGGEPEAERLGVVRRARQCVYLVSGEIQSLSSRQMEVRDDKEDDLVVSSTDSRVLRGGSFLDQASIVRSAYRLQQCADDP